MKLYNRQFAPKPRRVGMMVLEKGLNLPAIEEVIGDGLRLALATSRLGRSVSQPHGRDRRSHGGDVAGASSVAAKLAGKITWNFDISASRKAFRRRKAATGVTRFAPREPNSAAIQPRSRSASVSVRCSMRSATRSFRPAAASRTQCRGCGRRLLHPLHRPQGRDRHPLSERDRRHIQVRSGHAGAGIPHQGPCRPRRRPRAAGDRAIGVLRPAAGADLWRLLFRPEVIAALRHNHDAGRDYRGAPQPYGYEGSTMDWGDIIRRGSRLATPRRKT